MDLAQYGPHFPHLQIWGIGHDDLMLPLLVLESDVSSMTPREGRRSSQMDTGHLKPGVLILALTLGANHEFKMCSVLGI